MVSYRVEVTESYSREFHELTPMLMRYEIWHDEAGLWHREDGPAVIARDPVTARVTFQGWYIRGKLHRDDGPAVIYSEWEDVFQHQWYQHDKLHRKGAPADIVQQMILSGPVNSIERWYNEGRLHRVGGPATLIMSEVGVVEKEEWAINGVQSRIDGPSEIERDGETGLITEARWMLNGQHHRLDGPAYIRYDPATGAIVEQVFCRQGERVSPDRASSPRPV